jgi:NADH-ubiquinone oxidoreductase chain 1
VAEYASGLNPDHGFTPLLMSLSALISILLSYILALIAIAFYTLIERKFLGYFQTRKGPNKPGLIGLPVPFADAIKLFVKEQAKPTVANRLPFIFAPILSLSLALLLWVLFPHASQAFFIIYGILFFLCVSRTRVYATFIAG